MKKRNKKTKILAVGDIHGDTKFVERLAKKAKDEEVDLVILAGDLTFLEKSTKNLIGPFVKEKKEVVLIPGNHETMSTINTLTQIYEGTKHVHGYSVRKGDLGIFGSGYEPSTGPFFIEDEEIFKVLKKGNEKIKDSKKKIMVTHAHPKGSVAEFSGFPGSNAVKKAIKEFKPDILISAHIHEAGGLQEKIGKTKIIHVGRKPKIFEI
ncbi:MAG TPA: metallophosphoesterase [Candidatus Pacearchaeota archaeon]|nr:metallophosphoesterase [Candidatus Pacearchaeota archaeon]HPJ86635.1 metallophosphoesterase [Candidatus Pacearchaeota archaeon]